jgi:hypothetical protein
MHKMAWAGVQWVLSLVVCLSASLYAQIGGGSLMGTITDRHEEVIKGAQVTAVHTGTNVRTTMVTNEWGYYEFPLLPAGTYRIEAESEGQQKTQSSVFVLHAGTHTRVDLDMQPGEGTRTVDVDEAAPLESTTSADLGLIVERSRIDSLPLNGRNFQLLAGLQPGVINAPQSAAGDHGGIEFNGAPALSNNLLLDGVDMSAGEVNATINNSAGGKVGAAHLNTVSLEAIEEMKTTSSVSPAEYGGATGGVLNVITRSGSNQFHGTAFEYYRGDALGANSFFNKLYGLTQPAQRWNQYGGNLGGPALRDKLFFFMNYEGSRVRQSRTIEGNVPTAELLAALPPSMAGALRTLMPSTYAATSNSNVGFHTRTEAGTDDADTYLGRVDGLFGAHRIAARYNFNRQDLSLPQIQPGDPMVYPVRAHNASFQDTWTLSPHTTNELRVGLNRARISQGYQSPLNVPATIMITDIGINASLNRDADYRETSLSLADNYVHVGGEHTFKAGFDIRRTLTSRVESGLPLSTYASAVTAIADNPNTVTVTFGNPGRSLNQTLMSFFAQDDWRLNDRLQMNYGFRYEYFLPLRGAYNLTSSDPFGDMGTNNQGMFKADANNLAPRVGLAFDAFGNRKTIMRAGTGFAYAPPQAMFYYGSAFLDPRLPVTATYVPAELPAGISKAFPFPQSYVQQIAGNPSLLPANYIPTRTVADYMRRDEYAAQINGSVQQMLPGGLVVQFSYVKSNGLKLYSTRLPNQYLSRASTRRSQDFGDVILIGSDGRSTYEAYQITITQRLRHGLQFDLYYTRGKAMSYYGTDASLFLDTTVQDPNNVAGSYGPKTGDMKHVFTGVFSYTPPVPFFVRGSRAGVWLFGGWTLQGIATAHSGTPVNVLAGMDLLGTQRPAGQRPDYVSDYSPYLKDAATLTWLNPEAFSNSDAAKYTRYGRLPYNALRGPAAVNLDASIQRVIRLGGTRRVVLRCEAFNALNHMNPDNPVATLTDPNFGKLISGNEGRNVQLALKYQF